MRTSLLATTAAAFAWCLVVAHPASASVIWNGDASAGTAVFDGVLCDSPGSVTAQDNSDGRGTVFKFNKPLGLLRCEAHGLSVGGSRYTFKNNSTYYLGWDTSTNTPDAGTIFQWKSYGTNDQNQQNYPVLMKVEGGVLKLFHIEVGEVWTLKWSTPVTTSTYKRIVLGIHTSDTASMRLGRGVLQRCEGGRVLRPHLGRPGQRHQVGQLRRRSPGQAGHQLDRRAEGR